MTEQRLDRVATVKRLYFRSTAGTVQQDIRRAIELFKEMSEAERDRVAVYMDGLSQMRSEWAHQATRTRPGRGARTRGVKKR